jgi:hypothetical protein
MSVRFTGRMTVAALIACAGCGPKAPPASSPTPAASRSAAPAASNRAPRPRADLVTAEQARATHETNAYNVIEHLHPIWLRKRSVASLDPYVATDIKVIYNEREMGGLETLRDIRVETIISIQFFDSVMARSRWGVGYEMGAIVITGQ